MLSKSSEEHSSNEDVLGGSPSNGAHRDSRQGMIGQDLNVNDLPEDQEIQDEI